MMQTAPSAPSAPPMPAQIEPPVSTRDRKSTRLNSSHLVISYAVFCLKKNKEEEKSKPLDPRHFETTDLVDYLDGMSLSVVQTGMSWWGVIENLPETSESLHG